MEKIVVQNSGDRIDKYLSDVIDESRSTISKMIEEDFVMVNGNVVKASYRVKENDEIEIKDGFVIEQDIIPVKMDLNIVFEDNDIIVINKPSGLSVHPGSGNYDNTLVNGLMYYTKNLSDIGGLDRLGIVHRLDKDTSGLMIVAKNNKAHNILAEGFKNKTIKREYIALLNGVLPHETATIDAPIGRDIHDRKKMSVTASNSKDAITHLKVLKRFKDNTLVSLILETGRTHQIRVHAKYIGYPVFNDPVYSNKSEGDFGQFLHSWKLNFKHPITDDDMHFEIEMPDVMKEYISGLEE